ncbi:MAG TPA: glycine zipper domain-containing protein [Chitinophagaceae bacterium]
MKKLLSVFAIAGSLTMAACSSNPNAALQNEKGVTFSDTAGLAQFREWKAQQAMAEMYAAAAATAVTPVVANNTTTARRSSPVRQSSRTVSQNRSIGSTTQYPAKPAKKGWSKAAKGAAIGAGGGAIIGAVVNKRNRAVGAVIGGVAGGAVGYGIGRSMDKKDGRY